MSEPLQRFRLNDYTRVSAEFGVGTWTSEYVTVQCENDDPWLLEMTSGTARRLAKRLNKAASMLDPPKPRAKKETT